MASEPRLPARWLGWRPPVLRVTTSQAFLSSIPKAHAGTGRLMTSISSPPGRTDFVVLRAHFSCSSAHTGLKHTFLCCKSYSAARTSSSHATRSLCVASNALAGTRASSFASDYGAMRLQPAVPCRCVVRAAGSAGAAAPPPWPLVCPKFEWNCEPVPIMHNALSKQCCLCLLRVCIQQLPAPLVTPRRWSAQPPAMCMFTAAHDDGHVTQT